MNSRSALALMSAVAVFALVLAPAQAETQLRWKVQKGQQFKLDLKQTSKQVIPAQKLEVPIEMTMAMTWTVENVADGKIELAQVIDRITLEMTAPPPLGKLKLDTSAEAAGGGNPLAGMIGSQLKPIVGQKFVQTMTPRGEVLDVKVPEALSKVENSPLLGQVLGGGGFKDMIKQAAPVLPEKAIDTGFTWTSDVNSKTPAGEVKMSNKYTYRGETEKEGRQLATFDVATEMDLSGLTAQGAKIEIAEQDNKGTMYFDIEAGHFSGSSMQQKMTMKISAGTVNIEQKMESQTELTITPVR